MEDNIDNKRLDKQHEYNKTEEMIRILKIM